MTIFPVYVLLTAVFVSGGVSQKLCWGKQKSSVPLNSTVLFENFSAQKCMRVEALGILPNSNVVLDECLRKSMSKDQQFQIVNNSLNKISLKMDAGRGQAFCLTTSSSGVLKNTGCSSNSFAQSWTVKPVKSHPGQFTIEQYASKKCLKPKERGTGSIIQLAPCNSLETEQIWKLFYVNSTAQSNQTDSIVPC